MANPQDSSSKFPPADSVAPPAPQPHKKLSTAAWLAACVGLGLHRFYLGYYLIGTLQLLTLGGCLIWAWIDFGLLLSGKLKAADGSELIQD